MLSCKNLSASYFYGKKSHPVLADVSLELNPGELVCIAGPNGAGKSTLLTLMAGLEGKFSDNLKIVSASQEPSIDGRKIPELTRKECAQHIAFLSQSEYPAWDSTVLDTILTGRFAWSGTNYSEEDIQIAKEAACLLNITELLSRSVLNLSGGEYQKVRIARCLAQKPEYLLLDEPCAGLDFFTEPELLQTLREICIQQNIGILLSIHNLNLAAQFADRLILLPEQKPAISGTLNEVFTEKKLSRTYNREVKIYHHPILKIPQITF